MPETSRSDTSGHATLAATPARQGRFGKHMFWVLVFGTLLAAIGQLVPWLKQWHNEPDMSFGGTRMGNYFADYLASLGHDPFKKFNCPNPDHPDKHHLYPEYDLRHDQDTP